MRRKSLWMSAILSDDDKRCLCTFRVHASLKRLQYRLVPGEYTEHDVWRGY